MNPNTDTPIWKPIGNSLDYFISDDGQVKQICENGEERILHSTPDSSGYLHVCIESTSMLVHRLVAKAFIPNPHNYTDVHHRNGNRTDNRAENLMWCSHKRHMGKHNGIPIVHLNEDRELIGEYSSAAEAHRRTGVPASTIRSCCRRVNHRTKRGDYWMNREDYNQLVKQGAIIINPIISQKKGMKK